MQHLVSPAVLALIYMCISPTLHSQPAIFSHNFQSSERALVSISCIAMNCHCFLFHTKLAFLLIPAMSCTLAAIYIYIAIGIHAMHLQQSCDTCELLSGVGLQGTHNSLNFVRDDNVT